MFNIDFRSFILRRANVFILIFWCSCSQNKNSEIKYYPNGNIAKISASENNKRSGKEILFFDNRNIESITNYVDGLKEGEQLNFNKINGFLKSKLLFRHDRAEGVAYWYYESGSLRSSRNYINGKEWYVGFDYWDGKFVINKSLVRFDNGRVYYKLNFDSSGKPTYSEGDSLHSGVESVK